MNNCKKTGSYTYKVYNYNTKDCFGNIVLNKLLTLILDSAGMHANNSGFGKDILLSKGYTWVISRINIEQHSAPPKNLEKINIKTWLQNVKTAFSVRLFELQDDKGDMFASASTFWSIINTQTRKIVPVSDFISTQYIKKDRSILASLPSKLTFEKANDHIAEIIAKYSDLDYNAHVNSSKYLDWGLNTLGLNFLKSNELAKIEINYNQEVYHNDIIQVYTSAESKKDFILFNKTQNTIAAKIHLDFNPKDR